MQSLIRKNTYEVTADKCFAEVIANCATINREGQSGTWITADMKAAYIRLYEMGVAHSVEIWYEGKLAGGLYGIAVGRVFCGESMFSLMPSASKLALIYLCQSGRYDRDRLSDAHPSSGEHGRQVYEQVRVYSLSEQAYSIKFLIALGGKTQITIFAAGRALCDQLLLTAPKIGNEARVSG
jgi:leucyl/phenylalanyl-tRNA--protein transferase